jgi:hypothetical protein
MTDIDKLATAYEDALQAHRDDPDNAKKHQASVTAAEKLATARREQREADIAAGTRSAGVGVRADEVRRDDGTIGYRDEPAGGGN